MKIFSSRSGQAIIETLVALSVLTVGLMGAVSLLSNSLGLNRTVSDNYIATYLAAEGIEVVKNILDSELIQAGVPIAFDPWNPAGTFRTGNYEVEYNSASLTVAGGVLRNLAYDPAQRVYTYTGTTGTRFTRRIQIENVGGEEIRVNSIVQWVARGGGSSSVHLEDRFFKWAPWVP